MIKRLRDDSGQLIILAALSMTVVLGLVAFATDIGLLFRSKEVLQNAADSAAIAGAAELAYGDTTAAARTDAAQNGITNGVNGAVVTVNNPPLSGPNTGDASYVEVLVSQPQTTVFMKMFSKGSVTVGARAVAAAAPSASCVDTLQSNPQTPTGKKGALVTVPGIAISGGAFLTLPSCGIIDSASSSTDALDVTGGAGISATAIGVVGGATLHNGASVTPTPVTNIPAISDPLAATVSPPPSADYASGCLADPSITKSTTIGPSSPSGYVCYNGLSFPKGSPTVTLNPGLYIINGQGSANAYSLNVASGTIMNGTGVTFYFVNSGSFTISNGAVLNLSAPSSGSYSGLLFYQDPTDTESDSFVGGSSGVLNGIFYLPNANLTFQNGNSSTFSTDLIVGSLAMSGAATLHPYVAIGGSSVLSSPRLAE